MTNVVFFHHSFKKKKKLLIERFLPLKLIFRILQVLLTSKIGLLNKEIFVRMKCL